MKTNELKCTNLRIGNLIGYFGDIIKVDVIDCFDGKERVGGKTKDGEQVCDKPTYFDPIELTEEVLKKIVGVKVVDLDYNKTRLIGTNYHFNDCMVSLIYEGNKYQTKLISSKYKISLNVKHLHELQNTYHLLTNEELEVEL